MVLSLILLWIGSRLVRRSAVRNRARHASKISLGPFLPKSQSVQRITFQKKRAFFFCFSYLKPLFFVASQQVDPCMI